MKVAGTSVEAVLHKYVAADPASHVLSHSAEKSECEHGICGGRLQDGLGRPGGAVDAFYNHMTAREVAALLPLEFATYTKVCVVRNPWDQVVSMYSWLKPKLSPHITFDMYVSTITQSYDWDRMCVGGKFCMDHVLRYETLPEDLNRLADALGLESLPPTPHYKKSHCRDGLPYHEFYSTQSRKHVARIFHREIEKFGYVFEGCAQA